MNPQTITFLRRTDISNYLEDQTVAIGSEGGTDSVDNLLKGSELQAYECELEGKRIILIGFEPIE